jgi:hypothetical protein
MIEQKGNYFEFFNYLNGVGFKEDFSSQWRKRMVEEKKYEYCSRIELEVKGDEFMEVLGLRLDRFFSKEVLENEVVVLGELYEVEEVRGDLRIYYRVDWGKREVEFIMGRHFYTQVS